MKISIENFKSISALHNFKIKPFTVLSGINSSGKSSFIQLLLLLKQTVEKSSTDDIFSLDGKYYQVNNFQNLIYKKNTNNKISISFIFNKDEFKNSKEPILIIGNKIDISISFGVKNKLPFLNTFNIDIETSISTKNPFLNIKYNTNSNTYSIDANDDSFGKDIWNNDINNATVDFVAFYPNAFEIPKNGENSSNEKKFIKIDWARKSINDFLINISYLGPDRESPKSEYSFLKKLINVGIRGENTARILNEKANDKITFYKIKNINNTIYYELTNDTLSNAIKFWMCDIFKVAKNIYSEKAEDVYRVFLETDNDLKINIKHIGYGISQILPIIVQGFIMPQNGTLIVEQPEIHLHPKIQSQLFDFLYGLTLQGKKVIIETHSSHFITRMRRRIAEDETNTMDDKINLTFIEDGIFRTIKLDDYGTLAYFPKDFIEQDPMELKAIIKAQMKKRSKE